MTASAFAPVRDRQTIAAGSGSGPPDTFPKLLLEHARVRAGRPANREKDYGIWQSWSWAEVAGMVGAPFEAGRHHARLAPRPPLHFI